MKFILIISACWLIQANAGSEHFPPPSKDSELSRMLRNVQAGLNQFLALKDKSYMCSQACLNLEETVRKGQEEVVSSYVNHDFNMTVPTNTSSWILKACTYIQDLHACLQRCPDGQRKQLSSAITTAITSNVCTDHLKSIWQDPKTEICKSETTKLMIINNVKNSEHCILKNELLQGIMSSVNSITEGQSSEELFTNLTKNFCSFSKCVSYALSFMEKANCTKSMISATHEIITIWQAAVSEFMYNIGVKKEAVADVCKGASSVTQSCVSFLLIIFWMVMAILKLH